MHYVDLTLIHIFKHVTNVILATTSGLPQLYLQAQRRLYRKIYASQRSL